MRRCEYGEDETGGAADLFLRVSLIVEEEEEDLRALEEEEGDEEEGKADWGRIGRDAEEEKSLEGEKSLLSGRNCIFLS